MAKEKPTPIRVLVPDEFGDVYTTNGERQWVERAHRIGYETLVACQGNLYEHLSDEKAFKVIGENLADIFTDWNIEGDEGPLPKPWQNWKAFRALASSDYDLLRWVWKLPFKTIGELLDRKN